MAKCRRSTEVTSGRVNGLYLQKWSESRESTEIAIIGNSGAFGRATAALWL